MLDSDDETMRLHASIKAGQGPQPMTHTETQAMCERLDEAEKFLRKVSENVPAVEWGRTETQPDEAHLSDLADTLRFTREHFPEMPEKTSIDGLYLTGTAVVLAHTGNSPNSPKHAQMLAGLLANVGRLADEAAASRALLTRQQETIDRLREAAKGSAVVVNTAKEEVERLIIKWQDAMIMEAAVTELFWTVLKLTKAKITREEFDAKLAALQAKPDEGVNVSFNLSDEAKP